MLDSRNLARATPFRMQASVSVNGQIADAASATISIFDHGFLYGEGVYETLRTYGRVPFLFEAHMARLRRSAALMALDVPYGDRALRDEVERTMTAGVPDGEAYLRVLLTRGIGDLSYDPASCPTPSLVIIAKPLPERPAQADTEGVRIALVDTRRNHPHALNPLIKSNNLLNNALAMQEALRRGCDEALMCNQAGELAECAQSNFFVVRDGTLLTPPLTAGLLAGITRAHVMDLARALAIPCAEARLLPADLASASEACLTSTTRELTPVVAIDDTLIGDGRPGPIVARLLAEYRRHAASGAPDGGRSATRS